MRGALNWRIYFLQKGGFIGRRFFLNNFFRTKDEGFFLGKFNYHSI